MDYMNVMLKAVDVLTIVADVDGSKINVNK